MPQKQNPVRPVVARACAQLAVANASVLQSALVQEHQRAAGAWHAEWEALCGVLAYGAGAAVAAGDSLSGLVVDADRMLANLRASGGLVLSERLAVRLSEHVGRRAALDILADAGVSDVTFGDALRADDRVPLSDDELTALLEPTTYMGAADQLVERALAYYDAERARYEEEA
jgi:3-carboxy-cis,cis-muconate cycloisomerase